MRDSAPLVPTYEDVVYEDVVYIVLNDFGELGRAYVETDEEEADEQTIVENIIAGVYSAPLRVVAFNTALDWSHDVTKTVAVGVLRLALAKGYISKPGRDFVERVLGEEVNISV